MFALFGQFVASLCIYFIHCIPHTYLCVNSTSGEVSFLWFCVTCACGYYVNVVACFVYVILQLFYNANYSVK